MSKFTHEYLEHVARQFELPGPLASSKLLTNGHIHDTYAVRFRRGAGVVRYIVQRINHDIFKDIPGLMENIQRVTDHLRVALAGRGASATTLAIIPTRAGANCHRDADGNWSGTTTINIGGLTVIPGAKVTGKTTVNPDCTGTITYNKGTPTELNISYVMNPKTDETVGLITDKGTVASCVLKRFKYF